MSLTKLTLAAASFTLAACASAQPNLAPNTHDCPAEIEQIFSALIGDWTLSIQADEGWTGYGAATMAWSPDQSCGLVETSTMVFDQESETPMENQSSAVLAYDQLSETIKILTGDDRGYVHIGMADADAPLSFDIVRSLSETSVRQIQYRNIQPSSFEWSWRGRASPADDWADRLVIVYKRTEP